MKIHTAWYTEIGGREKNEDSAGVFQTTTGTMCIVADGLGGHAHGEIASRTAVDILARHADEDLSADRVQEITETVNREIVRLSAKERINTTLALLWISENKTLMASVGDTRIYQFRDGQIVFQSQDHSVAQLEVQSGAGLYKDVRQHPDRNKLFRAVGMRDGFKCDVTEQECRQGDSFLLCSDGFWEHILEQEMCSALDSAENPQSWLMRMREILNARLHGDCDNHTAVAVGIS